VAKDNAELDLVSRMLSDWLMFDASGLFGCRCSMPDSANASKSCRGHYYSSISRCPRYLPRYMESLDLS
jgi:hypothetical protein